MASQKLLEEARKYNSLSTERERSEFWQQLTATQQQDLAAALTTISQNRSASARRGCGGPVAAGCVGMVLGSLLTIGAEVALLMMGVQAVNDTLQTFSVNGGGGGTPADPAVLDNLDAQELLAYCGTEWEKRYPRIASVCWEQRQVDRINERIYRERAEQ